MEIKALLITHILCAISTQTPRSRITLLIHYRAIVVPYEIVMQKSSLIGSAEHCNAPANKYCRANLFDLINKGIVLAGVCIAIMSGVPLYMQAVARVYIWYIKPYYLRPVRKHIASLYATHRAQLQ